MNGRLLGNCQWLIVLACAAVSGAQARDPIQGSEALTFSDGASSINYRLYRPAGWDAPDADFPAVLFLHGAGERGSNNRSQVTSHIQGLIDATESGEFAAYLIAPQVPTGQQWTDVPFGTGSYSNPTLNAPTISNPLRLTLDLVEQFAGQEGVDETRLYITGLSMGGYGTLDAIARKPGLFAAALPLSGGGNLAFASTYVDIPIWAIHGAADPTVPPSGSRNTIAAIQNAGGTQERYTELAEQGHVIWAPVYNNGVFAFDTNYTGTYATDGGDHAYDRMFAQKAVPEPASALLLGVGALMIAGRGAVSGTHGRVRWCGVLGSLFFAVAEKKEESGLLSEPSHPTYHIQGLIDADGVGGVRRIPHRTAGSHRPALDRCSWDRQLPKPNAQCARDFQSAAINARTGRAVFERREVRIPVGRQRPSRSSCGHRGLATCAAGTADIQFENRCRTLSSRRSPWCIVLARHPPIGGDHRTHTRREK